MKDIYVKDLKSGYENSFHLLKQVQPNMYKKITGIFKQFSKYEFKNMFSWLERAHNYEKSNLKDNNSCFEMIKDNLLAKTQKYYEKDGLIKYENSKLVFEKFNQLSAIKETNYYLNENTKNEKFTLFPIMQHSLENLNEKGLTILKYNKTQPEKRSGNKDLECSLIKKENNFFIEFKSEGKTVSKNIDISVIKELEKTNIHQRNDILFI